MKYTLEDYMNMNYPIIVSLIKDDTDTYYKVSVPDLPGLNIYVDDKKEIESELKEAKKEWFASRIKFNQKIPLPQFNNSKSGRITLRVPKSLHAELEYKAEEEGTSLNQFLNYLIERGLEKENLTNKDIVSEISYNQISKFKQENTNSFSLEPEESSAYVLSLKE